MGFADPNECPHFCKLADDYLKKSKRCDQNIYHYFSTQPDAKSLYMKLVEELERSILGYFAFHWSQASYMINQVLKKKKNNIFKTEPNLSVQRHELIILFFCLSHQSDFYFF